MKDKTGAKIEGLLRLTRSHLERTRSPESEFLFRKLASSCAREAMELLEPKQEPRQSSQKSAPPMKI